ncbi:uncharacterized protein DS421_3g65830 [Arachis hypogaea]|nr:uncharacterized protein DS421_3g65830 [Arachis hypogaea]
MADRPHEEGHVETDSEQENLDTGNNDVDLALHQEVDNQHREGTSGVKNPKVNSSDGRESEKGGPSHVTELMGLVHSRLEQLEQERERQKETEKNLKEDMERRKELERKLLKLESSLKSRNSRDEQE